jgi:hypothetical protein
MRIGALPNSGAETARGEIEGATAPPSSLGERLGQFDWTPWLILALGTLVRFLFLGI